jgi:hypothetical protein
MSFDGNWNVIYINAVPTLEIPENVFVKPFIFIEFLAVF